MKSSTYWKAVLVDRDNLLDRVLNLLKDLKIRYCVIGGAGVNAYTYPVVTEDLDIVVAVEDMAALEEEFSSGISIYAGLRTASTFLRRQPSCRFSSKQILATSPTSPEQKRATSWTTSFQ